MFFITLPVLAHGATYYVAKTGSDSNSCTSAQAPSTPKLTINAGKGCLRAGDTLIVKAGVYPEVWGANGQGDTLLGSWPSGTTGAPITVKSEVRGAAIIRPSNLGGYGFMLRFDDSHDIVVDGFVLDAINNGGNTNHIAINAGHHITVQNCEIMNSSSAGTGGSQAIGDGIGAHHNVFANNIIHDIGIGAHAGQPFFDYVFYWHGNNDIFENNKVYNISGFGLHMYVTVSGVGNDNIIRNNSFTNVGVIADQAAMLIGDGGSNNQVYNNIVNNAGYGIQTGTFGASPSDNNQFYNNTVTNTHGRCVILGPHTSNAVFRNNICYGNNPDEPEMRSGATGALDHNLCGTAGTGCTKIGNPLFINTTGVDFHLQANSPAIDAGVNVGLPYNGSAPDLGALESGASVASVPPPTKLHYTLIGN